MQGLYHKFAAIWYRHVHFLPHRVFSQKAVLVEPSCYRGSCSARRRQDCMPMCRPPEHWSSPALRRMPGIAAAWIRAQGWARPIPPAQLLGCCHHTVVGRWSPAQPGMFGATGGSASVWLPAVPLRHSLQERQAAPAAGCPRSKGFPRIMPCVLGVALQVQKDIWDAVAPKKK